jgi:uncharacterized protein (TIGR02265 family)
VGEEERALTASSELRLEAAAPDVPPGFSLPDWNAPIDTEAFFRACPEDATAKGMFLQAMRDEVERQGKTLSLKGRIHAFGDYPMHRVMEIILETADLAFGQLTRRDGIRHVTRLAYTTFAGTTVGRAIFGIVGRKVGRILDLSPKAVAYSSSVGRLVVTEVDETARLLRISDVYPFGEAFSIGIIEGVLITCGRRGCVAQRLLSLVDGEFFVRWE